MERYKEYMDSGVQWLGEIPSHWDCVQFRGLFKITKRIAGKTGYDVLAVTQKGIKVKDVESNEGQIASDYSKYQLVDPGDFAMNHMDLLTGFIGISSQTGVTSPDYRVFKNVSPKANSKFYLYLFEMCYKQRIFYGLGHGVSNKGRWRLPAPVQNKFCIPLPPLVEQERIVTYIESKTSKIDAYIVEKEKEVQLLKELKEAEIAKVVTQGLNPNVKMKDSGISWIGMIPEHWETYRFAALCKPKSICNCEDEELLSVYLDRGVIRFAEEDNRRTNPTSKDLTKYQLVEYGDFVLNNQQAWRGSVGVSKYRGIISPAYFIFSLSNKMDTDFANYMFRSKNYVAYYYICSKGIGSIQRNLDWSQLKQKSIFIPSIEEQRSIVSYIENKCAKVNSLITELEAEIDYLKEYKQRLIADCVTGQVNVQNE